MDTGERSQRGYKPSFLRGGLAGGRRKEDRQGRGQGRTRLSTDVTWSLARLTQKRCTWQRGLSAHREQSKA